MVGSRILIFSLVICLKVTYIVFFFVKYSKMWGSFSIDLSEQSDSLFFVCTMQDKLPLESVNIVQNSCPARVSQFCCDTSLSHSAHFPLLFPTNSRPWPGDPLRGQDHGLGRIATDSRQRCRLYTTKITVPNPSSTLSVWKQN